MINKGDTITISGFGLNKSGDVIRRTKADNKPPPFWGINTRTLKRGKAVELAKFKAE